MGLEPLCKLHKSALLTDFLIFMLHFVLHEFFGFLSEQFRVFLHCRGEGMLIHSLNHVNGVMAHHLGDVFLRHAEKQTAACKMMSESVKIEMFGKLVFISEV